MAALWLWSRPRRCALSPVGDRRRLRWAPALLLALETGFLLSAGIPFWSVSSTYFATNPAITALQKTVGSSLVGYGSCRSLRYLTPSKNEVGIRPNANIGYGLHEMVVYDPILPASLLPGLAGRRRPGHPRRRSTSSACSAPRSPPPPRPASSASATCSSRRSARRPEGQCVTSAIVDREKLFFIPGSAAATVEPGAAGRGSLCRSTHRDPRAR